MAERMNIQVRAKELAKHLRDDVRFMRGSLQQQDVLEAAQLLERLADWSREKPEASVPRRQLAGNCVFEIDPNEPDYCVCGYHLHCHALPLAKESETPTVAPAICPRCNGRGFVPALEIVECYERCPMCGDRNNSEGKD